MSCCGSSLETPVAPLQEKRCGFGTNGDRRTDGLIGRQEGDLGPVYGHQWRNFGGTIKPDGTYEKDGVDQIQRAIDTIRNNPYTAVEYW